MITTKVLGYSFHHYQTKEGCDPLFFFFILWWHQSPCHKHSKDYSRRELRRSSPGIFISHQKNPQGVITPVKAKLCLRPLRDQLLVGALANKCVGRSEFQTLAVGWVCWGLLVAVGMACRGSVYMAPRNWSAMRPASRSPLRRAPWTVAG